MSTWGKKRVACAAVEVLEGSSLAGASSASQSFNALARRAKAFKDLEGSSLAGASHAFLADMVSAQTYAKSGRLSRWSKGLILAGVDRAGQVVKRSVHGRWSAGQYFAPVASVHSLSGGFGTSLRSAVSICVE